MTYNIMAIILGALAYIIPTFPLAYFWHLKLFKVRYEQWSYADEPYIPLGFASILIQGVALSVLYAWAPIDHTSFIEAMSFIGLLAIVHWSVHVVAAMAKNSKERNWEYFYFETLYLALQFGLFGLLISSLVY